MKYLKTNAEKLVNIGSVFGLSLILACGSESSIQTSTNSAPKISIDSFNCQSDPNTNNCRDIGLLSIEYQVSDDNGNLESVIGSIESVELGISQDMQLVGGKFQVSLSNFSGASDVLVRLTASDTELVSTTVLENIGAVSVNSPPLCNSPILIQNFSFNANGGNVGLIDTSTCTDLELDQISFSNNVLNTNVSGDYNNTVSVADEFGLSTDYVINGNIARRNLTTMEFTNQLIADPMAVGATTCFNPINQVFDETVICDFSGEWQGFQYDSSVDTSSFSNVALLDSAQGFYNFSPGPTLNEIVENFSFSDLADNQVVTNSGVSTIVVTGTIDRDVNGSFNNSLISGGYLLQGASSQMTTISCENQTYDLPIVSSSAVRSSTHTIDQTFIENVGQTQRISNCIATNANGIQTTLEGDLDIVVNDLANQNPNVNSVNGINQGFEGTRTIVANITDSDSNLSSVVLRYRGAGSSSAWSEVTLVQQALTDNYSATVTFDYASNLNEMGTIEYQVIALDTLGGQGTSLISNTTFFANENTAQTIIANEINLDPNKLLNCTDCSFTDPASGSSFGPFDALFIDASTNNQAFEYNGEERSAVDMANLANSVIGTTHGFHEIPIGTVSDIRLEVQNN